LQPKNSLLVQQVESHKPCDLTGKKNSIYPVIKPAVADTLSSVPSPSSITQALAYCSYPSCLTADFQAAFHLFAEV
jgi:hypothetical protein